ncbi:TetR/AcrR family transcriptional regulator [Paenibacillus barengoltzii]|uniref:TetR/AcrR family transcriptional regulator n=1 Tax=Paenibacillus barengoltzii TaxID=343517 RepID=UPI002FD89F11
MEKFLSLPPEKQRMIIDAALTCFGTNGYKKASINDIATEAGISKAMVFHYFGTKKALYLYLIEYCNDLVVSEIEAKYDPAVTDFFDRIKQATNIKVAMLDKHPALLVFLTSVYFETNEEVRPEIKAILVKGEKVRNRIALTGVDESKFREGVDLELLMSMLAWMVEGFISQMSRENHLDIENITRSFFLSLEMLRSQFYRPEYL